jgi:hypothetical protein
MAISRFVIATVVDPINRFSRWASPHVGEEVLVTIPSLTNCNSATTIFREIFVLRIAASFFETIPCPIFARWLAVLRIAFSVCPIGFANLAAPFLLQTTAGICVALAQTVGKDRDLVPTFAATEPQWSPIFAAVHA